MLAKEQYCLYYNFNIMILNYVIYYVLILHTMPFSPYQNAGVSHVECQALKGDEAKHLPTCYRSTFPPVSRCKQRRI